MCILDTFGQVLAQPYGSDPQLTYVLSGGVRVLARHAGLVLGAAWREAAGGRWRSP